jgi:hypothetical protein
MGLKDDFIKAMGNKYPVDMDQAKNNSWIKHG